MKVFATGVLAVVLLAGCESTEPKLELGEQCDLSSQCDLPLVCRLARCRTECATTRDCPIGQLCVQDIDGIGACLLPDETTCSLDSDCPAPLVCLGGGCTNECTIDRDCALGATCERDSAGRRFCQEAVETRCALDSDCAATGQVCAVDGVCRDECRTDRDCGDGLVCTGGACMPPDLPDAGVEPDAGGAMDGGVEPDAGPPDAGTSPDAGSGTDAGTADAGVLTACSVPADCTAPGVATADCVSGACVVSSCVAGLDDCDGDFADGCEARLAVDPLNCGACGASCGAYGRCSASTCDGIDDVGIGEDHACYLRGSGLVLCMGYDGSGQLGRGGGVDTYSSDPFPVPWITDAVAAEAGVYISCVLHADGTASCFGINTDGQLGDGTFTSRWSPVPVMGLSGIAQISPSLGATCAITAGGELWCWGQGRCGENGAGDWTGHNTPQLVATAASPVHVDTAQTHTCVAESDGTVECFGNDRYGELGDGVTTHLSPTCTNDASAVPVAVTGITDAIQVGVGYHWSCALHSGGTVSCWGSNKGGLGVSATATQYDAPQPVVGITDAVQITVGSSTACARLGDGRVMCWGDEALGAGASPSLTDPNEVVGITDAVDVEAGLNKACAALSTGQVTCWGYNDSEFGPDHLWEDLATPVALPTIRP